MIGHDSAVQQFEAALASGRLHHAWLLAGPQGVGKRRFADAMATKLLELDGNPAAAKLVEAGTHPDLRLLTPPEEGKGAAQRRITVELVRELRKMLHEHPAMGQWRVVIVDAADDMNVNAANALLKELEEPAQHSIFFLVSHAPAGLLPTIRSRCRLLRFGPLEQTAVAQLLEAQGMEPATAAHLAAQADGRPGLALALAAADGLADAIDALAAGRGDPLAFARGFQAATTVDRFALLLRLAPARLAAMARTAPSDAVLALQARAETLARDAIRLAFDRVQVAFALATLLAEAGTLHPKKSA